MEAVDIPQRLAASRMHCRAAVCDAEAVVFATGAALVQDRLPETPTE